MTSISVVSTTFSGSLSGKSPVPLVGTAGAVNSFRRVEFKAE